MARAGPIDYLDRRSRVEGTDLLSAGGLQTRESATGAPPLVSVIIPAFNRQATICAAIESVLRQTYAAIEVILIDDCSADGTFEAAANIADPRLRLVRAPQNLGSGGARNLGLAQAHGTWIAFQDSDDEWLPAKLEKQMERLLAPGTDYIGSYCGMMTIAGLDHREGQRSAPFYTPDPSIRRVETGLAEALLERNFISTQTLVVRRDAIRSIGGFDQSFPANEDWDLALRLALHGPLAFVDEPLVLQTFSANSLSRNTAKLLDAQQRMLVKHASLFASHPHVLARFYYLLAGGCRRMGDLPSARRYLFQALRLQPGNPKFLAMSGYVVMRSIMIFISTAFIV